MIRGTSRTSQQLATVNARRNTFSRKRPKALREGKREPAFRGAPHNPLGDRVLQIVFDCGGEGERLAPQ